MNEIKERKPIICGLGQYKTWNILKTKEQKLADIIRILMENERRLNTLDEDDEQIAKNSLKKIAEKILDEVC